MLECWRKRARSQMLGRWRCGRRKILRILGMANWAIGKPKRPTRIDNWAIGKPKRPTPRRQTQQPGRWRLLLLLAKHTLQTCQALQRLPTSSSWLLLLHHVQQLHAHLLHHGRG